MHNAPLAAVAAALLLGAVGQMLASRTRMPAIVFLLLLGAGAGPHGLGLVRPADLGAGLPVLVSAFVAIILFEGALTLRPAVLRQAFAPVRRLITLGAAVHIVGAAALAHWVTGLSPPLALLFATLTIVTGPTVIAPILRRVPLAPRLRAVLKSESILIDPVGVFAAVVVYQYVLGLASREASWAEVFLGFGARVGAGAVVGAAGGAGAALLLRLPVFRRVGGEQLVGLGAVALALGAFSVAEGWQRESGVMAVIVAGLILAAAPVPFREELERFKEQLTTLGVSVLFVLLAANLDLPAMAAAGWAEAGLLAGLVFAVRPAAVWLSTVRTGLTWREKAYVGLMAPRGILAAAVASYVANGLREKGVEGAGRVEALVFLTIAATVFLQGGWAAALARVLRVRPSRPEGVLLVGVNEWSLALARELHSRGRAAVFVDNNPLRCEAATREGFAARVADATAPEAYQGLDLSAVGTMLAVTPNDAVNTLACDAAAAWLGEEWVLQVIAKPSSGPAQAKVRMRGRWALPSRLPFDEVVQSLRAGRLRTGSAVCDSPTVIRPGLPTPGGPMLPLLVLEGGRLGVAVCGENCPKGGVLLGLVPCEPPASATGPAPAIDREGGVNLAC